MASFHATVPGETTTPRRSSLIAGTLQHPAMQRFLGQMLLNGGAAVGIAAAVAMFFGVNPGGHWLLGVALAKLTLIASGGLMAAGAICLRLDSRARERAALQSGSQISLPK